MTHNHQLDFELAARILKRGDARYFGMIGSRTKRKRFEYRLRERDFDAYLSLAARRAKRAPYRDRRIRLQARLSRRSQIRTGRRNGSRPT